MAPREFIVIDGRHNFENMSDEHFGQRVEGMFDEITDRYVVREFPNKIHKMTIFPTVALNRNYHHVIIYPHDLKSAFLINVKSLTESLTSFLAVSENIRSMTLFTMFVPCEKDVWYYFLYLHMVKQQEIFQRFCQNAKQQRDKSSNPSKLPDVNIGILVWTGRVTSEGGFDNYNESGFLTEDEEKQYQFLSFVLTKYGNESLPNSVVDSFLKLYVRL